VSHRSALAGAAISVALAVSGLAGCGDDSDSPAADSGDPGTSDAPTVGYMTDPAPAVGEVSLPELGEAGGEFTFEAAPGRLLLVFFGFANCPDICPGTLSNVKFAVERLGERAGDVDLAMVTVDPDRDLDTLAAYVEAYVPTAHALGTADPVALQRAADAFGVTYQVQPLPGGGTDVGHTSALYGVDDEGSVVITWLFGTSPTDLAADLEYLLDQAA
jgi:protein SCO1/2